MRLGGLPPTSGRVVQSSVGLGMDTELGKKWRHNCASYSSSDQSPHSIYILGIDFCPNIDSVPEVYFST